MAECGSGSQNSSGSSGDPLASKQKKVATKWVKSRYMQYDKPKIAKKPNMDNSATGLVGKVPAKDGTPTRKSVQPQRSKVPSAMNSTVADASLLWKDNLQSTLLEGHKIVHPKWDVSAINDKTFQKITSKSLTPEQKKPKREAAPVNSVPDDLVEMYESQTLLLTYLTLKIEENLKQLEEKAERNLLLASQEKNRLQDKVFQLKRDIALSKKQEQLNDLLTKQSEDLVPSSAAVEQFKQNYISFATAVDCTRHQLPINNIHVVGTRQQYLDNIQKHLITTTSLLEDAIPRTCDGSTDLLGTIKSLEDVALKTDTELSRSLHQVLDLSSKVNKEISLQNQKSVEENSELDMVKQWYFD